MPRNRGIQGRARSQRSHRFHHRCSACWCGSASVAPPTAPPVRHRNVCMQIVSLRLVTGDQLQRRDAATAAPAHGLKLRTILMAAARSDQFQPMRWAGSPAARAGRQCYSRLLGWSLQAHPVRSMTRPAAPISTSSAAVRSSDSPYHSGVAVCGPMPMPAAASRASVGASGAPSQPAALAALPAAACRPGAGTGTALPRQPEPPESPLRAARGGDTGTREPSSAGGSPRRPPNARRDGHRSGAIRSRETGTGRGPG